MTKLKIKFLTIEFSKSKQKNKINMDRLEKDLLRLKSQDNSDATNKNILELESQIDDFYTRNREAFILRSKVSENIICNEACSKILLQSRKTKREE